jgi:hypothetical protein
MRSKSQDPELSVVVVVLAGREALRKCLASLQRAAVPKEIIVPYDSRLASIQSLAARYPEAVFVPVSGVRTYAELRAIGIARSRGEVVALTEDHCIPDSRWCSEVLRRHKENRHAAIGGVVEKQTPDAALNWAFYFADYVRYMNPVREGLADHLTDCNVSYKRSALGEITGVWTREFHENVVHTALRSRGHDLYLSSRLVVHQCRNMGLGAALWDRYAFGRLFASTRIRNCGPLRRLLFAGSTFILPALLVGRSARHVFEKRRHRLQFARCLPQVALLGLTWAIGELAGYVTGHPERVLSVAGPNTIDDPAGHAIAK